MTTRSNVFEVRPRGPRSAFSSGSSETRKSDAAKVNGTSGIALGKDRTMYVVVYIYEM
jgi:hypothetical protein